MSSKVTNQPPPFPNQAYAQLRTAHQMPLDLSSEGPKAIGAGDSKLVDGSAQAGTHEANSSQKIDVNV
tara:strand:- start:346 stop:549 length:204 start_codon:yes stop_codon:yes gene_type:complete